MEFGDVEVVRAEDDLRLLKVGCRNGKISNCVIGNGPVKHYDDYEDALEDFNLRWMRLKYGD